MLRTFLSVSLALMTAVLCAAASPRLAVPTMEAPSLERVKCGREISLGLWDDIFAAPNADMLVLRRGAEVHCSSLDPAAPTQHLLTHRALENSRIVYAAAAHGHRWIFLERPRRDHVVPGRKDGREFVKRVNQGGPAGAPLAVDLDTATLVEFVPTNVRMIDSQQIGIWASPDVGGAIVTVVGVDPASAPTETPVYQVRFWLNLMTGKIVQLPLHWSCQYLSTDLRYAVSERWEDSGAQEARASEPAPKAPRTPVVPFDPEFPPSPVPPPSPVGPLKRIVSGLEFQTGRLVDAGLPDWEKEHWIDALYHRAPLSAEAEPLCGPKPHNARPTLVGVASFGNAFPWKLELEYRHSSTAKAAAGWAALRYGRWGEPENDAATLWFGPLVAGADPTRLASDVQDYEVLNAGRCVFIAKGADSREDRHALASAYVYENETGSAWDVLEGAAGLPPLDQETAALPFVEDTMSVRLLTSFGSPSRGRMVLTLCDHFRADRRAAVLPRERRVAMERWRGKMLLTAHGRRFAIDLVDREQESLWLHNSSVLVRAATKVLDEHSGQARRLEVSLLPLELPAAR